jgi:hypothetical protein
MRDSFVTGVAHSGFVNRLANNLHYVHARHASLDVAPEVCARRQCATAFCRTTGFSFFHSRNSQRETFSNSGESASHYVATRMRLRHVEWREVEALDAVHSVAVDSSATFRRAVASHGTRAQATSQFDVPGVLS